MSLMKEYLMRLEELAWDAVEAGAQTDEEICGYIRNYFLVDLETVKQVTRQMYLGGPGGTEGLDKPADLPYN